MTSVYDWPDLIGPGADADDESFAAWALAVNQEIIPVREVMGKALPDDPRLLREIVTEFLDGWLPRVAALSVLAEYHLDAAKARKWPGQISDDGEKLNVTDREVRMTSALAPYRLVRDDLEQLVRRMHDRVMWVQSVLKLQESAQ